MKHKWVPITAGIYNIIVGVSGILIVIFVIGMAPWFESIAGGQSPLSLLALSLLAFGGAWAVIGGIYGIKRSNWPLALLGSVSGFLLSTAVWMEYWLNVGSYGLDINTLRGMLIIPAAVPLVFTFLGKKQFTADTKQSKHDWLLTVSGVVTIYCGVLGIMQGMYTASEGSEHGFLSTSLYDGNWGLFVILEAIFGIAAIIGGIYSLKRKKRILALIGTVCGVLPTAPFMVAELKEPYYHYNPYLDLPVLFDFKVVLAILALLLLIVARHQFNRNNPVVP